MESYLKIENPGVAFSEAFTLLGASTKRGSDNGSTIGKFGTGNKHGISLLLRKELNPIIFAGSLRMDFTTRVHVVNDGIRNTSFNRVVVKFGGKDSNGASRSNTEDLGFVLEHGSSDWLDVELALREFVSNSIDRAVEEGELSFLEVFFRDKDMEYQNNSQLYGTKEFNEVREELTKYRASARDWKNVTVEIVNKGQVRAKAGTTRIFIPLNNDVFRFYNDIGKWFLHFSEPDLLGSTILPKSNRNIGNRRSAVIYRRGVRVREFESSDTVSLYDYNLENLKLDESRRVDDWYVQHEAAKAFSSADISTISRLWDSFINGEKYWEHSFSHYGLEHELNNELQRKIWCESFEKIAGDNAVICTEEGGEIASRKGYKIVKAPQAFVQVAEKYGIKTPSKVLSEEENAGREVFDANIDADCAVNFVWEAVEKLDFTNGKSKPMVKTFRKIMEAGSQVLGFYKNGVVYINQDISGSACLQSGYSGLTQQLIVTALEEVVHHITQSTDNSRDFQDYCLNLAVYLLREKFSI
jgi:hypothetical protein